jgi:ATP-dependent helicase HrpA
MTEKIIIKRKKSGTDERRRALRLANIPRISYPEALPITAKKDDIIDAIKKNPVVIITGETGSGKTTQIPKMCLEAGRGIFGVIGCTQPRRVAAMTVAYRIAEELGEDIGRSVGYQIRFEDKSGRNNYIKIMTDGILLNEAQHDPWLRQYDTIIVDEAHERSLNIDFVLGILKTLLRKRRDLKVIITSATIDTEKFSRAFQAPIIEVSGRMYPVEVRYKPLDHDLEEAGEITYVDAALSAVENLMEGRFGGDILLFMPTEQDIRETCDQIESKIAYEATVLPLFARLPWTEQRRVFQPSSSRKIVVATNVAETSITIPGIRYVIDTGLARISQYNPRSRTTSLPIRAISKSSADQRKGRCGRVENGICVRLFDKDDYEDRPLFTEPEILRSNLAEVILRMLFLNLGDISSFPFIDPPHPKNIRDGIEILKELGAIKTEKRDVVITPAPATPLEREVDRNDGQNHSGAIAALKKNGGDDDVRQYSLTERGKIMARLPIDPRISRMIIEAQKEGCLKEILIIAAALSIQDPRERPMEFEKEADKIHASFADPLSDFITLLRIWNQYQGLLQTVKSTNRMKKFCREHYLSFRRMREWADVYDQLRLILDDQGWAIGKVKDSDDQYLYEGIHKSILSGHLSNIAMKKEKNHYTAAKGKEVMLFPGSGIFNKGGNWIVAAEMIETSRLFARMAANIKSEWLEELGGDLCRSIYSEPHWSRDRGEVTAYEQVMLFGLTIIPRRPVSYGRIKPDEASEIFIRSALIEGDIKKPLPFLIHNQKVIERISTMEEKIRRRNLLASEDELARFYVKRIPSIYDVRTLQKLIRDKGSDDFLRMKEEDVLQHFPPEDTQTLYPDDVVVGNQRFSCTYRFEPGKADDGVTVKMPIHTVSAISGESADWLIPGLVKEKMTALLKGLPKEIKKKLQPISHACDMIIADMKEGEDFLLSAMGKIIYEKFGVDIPASTWNTDALSDYLKIRYAVVDEKGHVVSSGRDIMALQKEIVSEIASNSFIKIQKEWEKTGLKEWNFGDLPEMIPLGSENHREGYAYPGLEAGDGCVNIRLFKNRWDADESHRKGIMELYAVIFNNDLRYLKKTIVIKGELKRLTDDAGLTKILEKAIYERTIYDLFNRPFRTQEAFEQHARDIASTILPTGQDVLNGVIPLIKAYCDIIVKLRSLEKASRNNGPALQYLAVVSNDLNRLMPPDFILLYHDENMTDIIRYLKAMGIRAERGLLHLEKAFQKTGEVKIFVDRLQDMVNSLTPYSSDAKKKALEELKWMIEEYKISLFAQEIKTAFPISVKRLEKKLQEIERMI